MGGGIEARLHNDSQMGARSRSFTYSALKEDVIPKPRRYSSSSSGKISNQDQVGVTPLIRAREDYDDEIEPKIDQGANGGCDDNDILGKVNSAKQVAMPHNGTSFRPSWVRSKKFHMTMPNNRATGKSKVCPNRSVGSGQTRST